MERKIVKVGNSPAVRIPSELVKALNWDHGTHVEIIQDGNKLIIEEKRKYKLRHLLQGMTEENYADFNTWEDDTPVGKELL